MTYTKNTSNTKLIEKNQFKSIKTTIFKPLSIKKNSTKKLEKGFSILELIIVLLVSGIMSSVVIPNFSKIQDYAKTTNLKQTLYVIQMGIETFFLEQGYYPEATSIDSLLEILNSSDYLKKNPTNAYTNTTFSDTDTSGLITYSFNNSENNYTLSAYNKHNESIILTLEN